MTQSFDRPPLTTEPAPPPAAVQNAVRLMLLRSLLQAISLGVLFGTWGDLKRHFLEKTPDATSSSVDAELTTAAAFGIVTIACYAFLAFQVRRRANWARVVTWVIAGLGILGAVLSFDQPDPPLSRTLGILVALLDVAVVVLLARGESNRWFRCGRGESPSAPL